MSHPTRRRALLIAYHFPPLAGSSGIQRTLRLAQHLPQLGWDVSVLTCQPRAYERVAEDLLAEVPAEVHVERAFTLDAARHLSIGGRHFAWTTRPDRWASWRLDGVRRGLALLERLPHHAIWSTYPIPTAHVIGAALARRSGLPWIADFRDPMVQPTYPADAVTRAQWARLEALTCARARLVTVTTPGTQREMQARHPGARIELMENGYDEASFAAAPQAAAAPLHPGAITLLHSGIVYPSERDPTQFIEALALLRAEGFDARQLRVRFRAPVHAELITGLTAGLGVADMVEVLPAVNYRAALEEMQRADGLLVMQAANCNAQVPAKVYEYLRAGPKIVTLADPAGDTAQVLRDAGVTSQAPLDDAPAIAALLRRLCQRDAALQLSPTPQAVTGASRWARSEQFVRWLEAL
ncbi:MAG: glycosyltransferase [Roseateles sp.]|uniref:glycosyltransferase n=1 Tax=Roseateles sp. TaxID=1971397 RepID=UPI0039EB7EE2